MPAPGASGVASVTVPAESAELRPPPERSTVTSDELSARWPAYGIGRQHPVSLFKLFADGGLTNEGFRKRGCAS